MKKPKVLVGCPTAAYYEYCLDEYAKSVKSFTYPHYDVLLVDNSKDDSYIKKIKKKGLNCVKGPYSEAARQRIIDSRNILREKTLEGGYDYFFSLEQDIVPPKDVIERLLSHKKKLVSGVYFIHENHYTLEPKMGGLYTMIWVADPKLKGNVRTLTLEEVETPQLLKVRSSGLGCLLIHRDVLKDIKFRYDDFFTFFDDQWFGFDCYKKGFERFVDTAIKCKHFMKGRGWQWAKIQW